MLVRVAVFLYQGLGTPTWLALAFSATLATGIITLYGAWISRRLSARPRLIMVARWVAVPLVASYCGYALIYLAGANVKDSGVRATYRSAHPLLRVALSTVILVDGDLVVTDLGRTPDDYRKMGLGAPGTSLHYPQADGWIHAVDLRTSDHGFVRNAALRVYFVAMGFETLRHTGTGDHLHVALARPS